LVGRREEEAREGKEEKRGSQLWGTADRNARKGRKKSDLQEQKERVRNLLEGFCKDWVRRETL
jgi:hypothetical protein